MSFELPRDLGYGDRRIRGSAAGDGRNGGRVAQFAYSASHDLQQPLRMVSIYSELLRRKFERKLGRQADEYIRYTVQGALRMEELVRDLLAYTQASNVAAEPSTIIDANKALDKALTGRRCNRDCGRDPTLVRGPRRRKSCRNPPTSCLLSCPFRTAFSAPSSPA